MRRKKAGNQLHGVNPRTIRTDANRSKFLETLKATCNITRSCEASGLARSAVYEWRDEDPAFAADWEEALDIAGDTLVAEAVRRAVEGVDRPVFQGGRQVGVVREYSDTLLVVLLKAFKREKFGELQYVKYDGRIDMGLRALSDEERAAKIAAIMNSARARIADGKR